MSLSIGIIGLPNVGKSTLFNALLKRQVALAANYPFATIDPNVGVVEIPDINLGILADIIRKDYIASNPTKDAVNIPNKISPANIKFVDIAGLVRGASKGEGLGNKFLSNIKEVDAILHVVRSFEDTNIVREGSVDPKQDVDVINTELILSDLETLESRIQKFEKELRRNPSKENKSLQQIYEKILDGFKKGYLANQTLQEGELELIRDLNLLTAKKILIVENISEDRLHIEKDKISEQKDQIRYFEGLESIRICAKIESDLSSLSTEDQTLYMKDIGLQFSALDILIAKSFDILSLQAFYTAGDKEIKAWVIEKGTKAPQAAGKIHTDIEQGFVKAEVVSIDDLVSYGSYKKIKESGFLRVEGKEYIMRVGDVVEFKFNKNL